MRTPKSEFLWSNNPSLYVYHPLATGLMSLHLSDKPSRLFRKFEFERCVRIPSPIKTDPQGELRNPITTRYTCTTLLRLVCCPFLHRTDHRVSSRNGFDYHRRSTHISKANSETKFILIQMPVAILLPHSCDWFAVPSSIGQTIVSLQDLPIELRNPTSSDPIATRYMFATLLRLVCCPCIYRTDPRVSSRSLFEDYRRSTQNSKANSEIQVRLIQ